MKSGWRGIYSLHTKSNRYTLITKLDETDFGNENTKSWLGKLDGTDSLISVGPKCYERETGSLHCNLSGTDRSLRLDRNVTKGNREITIPSR